jgi:hypothetical protein
MIIINKGDLEKNKVTLNNTSPSYVGITQVFLLKTIHLYLIISSSEDQSEYTFLPSLTMLCFLYLQGI